MKITTTSIVTSFCFIVALMASSHGMINWCSCTPGSQSNVRNLCDAGYVCKVKVKGSFNSTTDLHFRYYRIKTLECFNLHGKDSANNITKTYVKTTQTCGVILSKGKKYLLSGRLMPYDGGIPGNPASCGSWMMLACRNDTLVEWGERSRTERTLLQSPNCDNGGIA